MVLPTNSDKKQVAVIIEKKQDLYLRENRYPRSQFMRQAITAQQQGKWEYNPIQE